MKVTITSEEDYVLVQLEGTLDEGAKSIFDSKLHPLIEADQNRLIIDMARVNRVTSAGLGLLVTLVSRANTKGSQVVLARPSAFVDSIMQATKLTKFFDLETTLDGAVARLS